MRLEVHPGAGPIRFWAMLMWPLVWLLQKFGLSNCNEVTFLGHRLYQPVSSSLVIRTPAPCPYTPLQCSLRSSAYEALGFWLLLLTREVAPAAAMDGWPPWGWPIVTLIFWLTLNIISTSFGPLNNIHRESNMLAVVEGKWDEARLRVTWTEHREGKETMRASKTITDRTQLRYILLFICCSGPGPSSLHQLARSA